MPSFYKIVNSTAVKAAPKRVFVYLVLNNGEAVSVGYTSNLHTKIARNNMVEAIAEKYKRPASIWVVGTMEEEKAAKAVRELTYVLRNNGCPINKLDESIKPEKPEAVTKALGLWHWKYHLKSNNRTEERSRYSASDMREVIKEMQFTARERKLVLFLIENYYQNYGVSIAPMPLFYYGNSDLYRKDLNAIKHILFTKDGLNTYASNNFHLSKHFQGMVDKYLESQDSTVKEDING
jgi:hypothetical protein